MCMKRSFDGLLCLFTVGLVHTCLGHSKGLSLVHLIIIISLTSILSQNDQGYEQLLPNSIYKVDNEPLATRDFSFSHSDASILRKSCLITIRQLSIHGNVGASFLVAGDAPRHINQLRLGKKRWNLETSSAVVEFPPPYHNDG